RGAQRIMSHLQSLLGIIHAPTIPTEASVGWSELIKHHPGILYIVATLLPLVSFLILLLKGAVRNSLRASSEAGIGGAIYRILGGDKPSVVDGYIATAAIAGSFILCLYGFVLHAGDHGHDTGERWSGRTPLIQLGWYPKDDVSPIDDPRGGVRL